MRRRHAWSRLGFFLLMACASLLAGCGKPRRPEPLRIAAASDLATTLPGLAARFQTDHKGLEVVPVFGSSGDLARQIRQGAPFDLFLSADREFVTSLAQEGLVDRGSIRPYSIGQLALVVPAGSRLEILKLEDLKGDAFQRLAIANPELAPYGRAAREMLRNAGLWQDLEPKIAEAETVSQALKFVESGNAEAGFVCRALADPARVRTCPVELAPYQPIVQTLGVVRDRPRSGEAAEFAAFLTGVEGQKVLVEHGFLAAPVQPKP